MRRWTNEESTAGIPRKGSVVVMILQIGTGFVALGLVIALVIVFVSVAANALNSTSTSSPTSQSRRSMLDLIVTVGVGGFVVAILGGPAITELFEEDPDMGGCELVVEDGESFTVNSGESVTACEAQVSGTLNVNGQLSLTD